MRKLDLTREGIRATVPLREYFVFWDDITPAEVEGFEQRLNAAPDERAMQEFLEQYPLLLIQHLGGGHGRWVIPHQRLGAEHVTDFLIADKNSLGFEWTAVELESPTAKMFTKDGDPTATLSHAIRQIADWRAWLQKNQTYAARARSEKGLGLTDIDPRVPGLIVIGREADLDLETRELRRQLGGDLRIAIHTYDWLLRTARGRAEAALLLHAKTDRSDNA